MGHVAEDHFEFESLHFEGMPVSMVYADERTNTWWVALSHRHWGEKLHRSIDEGKTWQECTVPSYAGYDYKPGKPASLKKIWVMKQAGNDKPNCLWLGSEPGGLFYSDDNGETFSLNEGLWNHPSRHDETQWFGAGKDYPFIHSILVDPGDSNHIYVGISCAGVFESKDGGQSWQARNNGLVAAYLPNPKQEVGHDPHLILMSQKKPEILWQQNHCGIFRTIDGGERWEDVSGKNGFPKYGFCIAIDENDPDKAWVIPAQNDEKRIPVGLRLRVCKTVNGGHSWSESSNGLPTISFELVLRSSFTNKAGFFAFGTNSGNLYVSFDEGTRWTKALGSLSNISNVKIIGAYQNP